MVYKFLCLIFIVSSVSAEHPGAYSSPQYAKKMFPKQYDGNALLPREKVQAPFRNYDTQMEASSTVERNNNENDTTPYGRSTLLSSAGEFLSGAGGQMMTNLAKDFIARSTGSSQVGFECITQVLSLNLTNLVILVVLKALILAAGFFGAGAYKGDHHYARSIDDNKNATYISEDEILLYLSYLAGYQSKNYGCLYRLSCQRPKQAGMYASGADLLLQGAKLVQSNEIELHDYEEVSQGIKEAASWGKNGGSCYEKYKCGE